MAASPLDDEAAIQICRTPSPGSGAVKAVLQWARNSPSPEKIPYLLLLQTKNHLNRKSLSEGYYQVLAACASDDPSPLWNTIEADWETYRVWHAIRAVAFLRDKSQTEKLIALGRRPILSIHWDAVKEAASAQGIPIPDTVSLAQAELERQRGPDDFHAVFLSRKTSWPPKFDLQEKIKPEHHNPTGGEYMAKPAVSKPAADAKTSAVPTFLDADREPQDFLKAHKRALSKTWSLKSMNPLYAGAELAYFLVSLKRDADAAEICDLLAGSVSFSNNFNIWTPVGHAICLRARLLRQAGKAGEADAALAPIITHPYNRTPPQAQIDKDLGALPANLEEALAQSAKKASCQTTARKLFSVCWYLEMSHAKVPGFSGYAPGPLEELWRQGLEKLAARLES